MPTPTIVDLSHHNTVTDLSALKAAGIVGVIHKATEGTSYVDPTFAGRREAAGKAGLAWASYHFLTGADPLEQMRHYLDTAQPQPGERVVLDHEADATLQQLEAAVQYLASVLGNLQITVYSGHVIKDQLGTTKNATLAEHTSLWVAQYNNTGPSWPTATWPTYSLWQYTDQGALPGIEGRVDLNQFNGDPEQAKAWMGPASIPRPDPDPTPEVPGPVVALDVTLPDGVTLDIRVNGKCIV